MADHEVGVHAQVWEAQLRPWRGSRGQCPLHSEAGCLGGGCREGPSFWLRPPLSQPGPRRRSPWESAAPGSADPRFMAQPQGRRRTPSQGNKSELILACWLLLLSTADLQATAHLGAGERAGGAGTNALCPSLGAREPAAALAALFLGQDTRGRASGYSASFPSLPWTRSVVPSGHLPSLGPMCRRGGG